MISLYFDQPGEFYSKAKRLCELRKLQTLHELSPGMRKELTAPKACWSAARKSAK